MYKNNLHFSQKELADSIRIWNGAAITLLDIRHNLISPKEIIRNYRLPASAFLYTCGARAEVLLNDTSYHAERFGLFHSGKGTELSILPQNDWMEYYLVLYKAGEPPFYKREYARLLEQVNPFRQQYGFAPPNPLFFMEQLRKMYERWKGPTPLNLFYGKISFYHLVYEIYEALDQGKVHVFEPDIVTMAQRYLDGHFSEAVIIQELCGMLGVSYSSFYRSFKQKAGVTPQEYLISARLAAAKEWLESGNASIREVAEHCGFPDEHNFYRLFTKSVGVSPNAYRQISYSHLKDNTIGNLISFPYNREGQVSLDKLKGKGVIPMFKQTRSKTILAAALSLMLLLSACGVAPANTSGGDSTSTSEVTSQGTETEATVSVEEETRIVKTELGDVEVPVNPQNIVVVDNYMADLKLLGIDYVKPESTEPEAIMELDPDIIITYARSSDMPNETNEKFPSIAPTIVLMLESSPEENFLLLGQVFGKEEEAKRIIAQFEEDVESAKTALTEEGVLDKSISLITVDGESAEYIYTYDGTWGRGGRVLFHYLGLKNFNEEYVKKEHYKQLSLEVLGEYLASDYIVVGIKSDSTEILEETEIWKSIPAVKNNKVIKVPYTWDDDYMDSYAFAHQINGLDFFKNAFLKQ